MFHNANDGLTIKLPDELIGKLSEFADLAKYWIGFRDGAFAAALAVTILFLVFSRRS